MAKQEAVETAVEAPVKTKRRRLSKVIDGSILTITEALTETEMKFDFSELPAEIQSLFGPFGMSQKLGDSAAGKKGQEAVDSIMKVWEGLKAGNWTVRAPAAAKITKKSILGAYEDLPDGKEKTAAAELLKKLGIIA
mgnify:CR=1 FL=1|jgi:hypothetical protein